MEFLTPDVTSMSFTDWTRIKAALGASDVTGSSSDEDKVRVLIGGLTPARPSPGASPGPAGPIEYAADGYGRDVARLHAGVWGFDVLDHDWDASFQHGSGPSIHVIRLREDFEMAALFERFDEREYTSEPVGDSTLRTHEQDLGLDWQSDLPGAFAILNVGILPDDRTLVMSISDDAVREVLAGDPAPIPSYLQEALAALGAPSAAFVQVGSNGLCESMGSPVGDSATANQVRQLLEAAGPLSAWDAVAIGYSRDLSPIGRIAIGYSDAGRAADDLAGRRLLAEQGISVIGAGSFPDRFFTVQDAQAADGVITLEVAPADDWPRWLFVPLFQRDAIHLACTPG